MKTNILRNIASLVIAGALAGCASNAKKPSEIDSADTALADSQTEGLTSDFSRSKLIAADFVSTMAQIPSADPTSTILRTARPTTRFGNLLLGALQNAGYDLRIGSETSQFWLDYSASLDESTSDAGNPVYVFVVSAGEVELKRSYEVDQYGVWPAGNMFVRGGDVSNVVIDESIFSNRRQLPDQAVEQPTIAQLDTPLDSGDVTLQAVPARKTFVKTRESVSGSAANVEAVEAQEELAASLSNLQTPKADLERAAISRDYSEFTNMYETLESRYKDLFANYQVLDSKVLVFADDSLVLGRSNKFAIRQQIANFDPSTDLISVIGCSHGTTALENGNAYLANSRAARVKEEFVVAGLDGGKVYDEGCWAGESFSDMPDRGVLVEHRRLFN